MRELRDEYEDTRLILSMVSKDRMYSSLSGLPRVLLALLLVLRLPGEKGAGPPGGAANKHGFKPIRETSQLHLIHFIITAVKTQQMTKGEIRNESHQAEVDFVSCVGLRPLRLEVSSSSDITVTHTNPGAARFLTNRCKRKLEGKWKYAQLCAY